MVQFIYSVNKMSSISRMNFGKMAEHYLNANIVYQEKEIKKLIEANQLIEAKDRFMKFISIVSPIYHEWILKMCPTEQDQINATIEEVKDGLQIYLPQDTPNIGVECAKQLMDEMPLPTSPVTYRGLDGKLVRTVKDVVVGSLYTILLEKVGDDWGATSIPKRQHHGIPGKLTDADKTSLPWRDQAFKMFGESETRLLLGTLEPSFVATLTNFPNSPAMCMDAAKTILTAPQPTNIIQAMDYKTHSELQGRSVQYFNHILNMAGIAITKGELDND